MKYSLNHVPYRQFNKYDTYISVALWSMKKYDSLMELAMYVLESRPAVMCRRPYSKAYSPTIYAQFYSGPQVTLRLQVTPKTLCGPHHDTLVRKPTNDTQVHGSSSVPRSNLSVPRIKPVHTV